MSSARHRQTMSEFLNSPEAQQPLAPVPYHDPTPQTPSSSREIAERAKRLAHEETRSTERAGHTGGTAVVAPTIRARVIDDVAPSAVESQGSVIAAMKSEGATKSELVELGYILKNHPKLRDASTWIQALKKLRRFRRGI
jgi:hypothetical protein